MNTDYGTLRLGDCEVGWSRFGQLLAFIHEGLEKWRATSTYQVLGFLGWRLWLGPGLGLGFMVAVVGRVD